MGKHFFLDGKSLNDSSALGGAEGAIRVLLTKTNPHVWEVYVHSSILIFAGRSRDDKLCKNNIYLYSQTGMPRRTSQVNIRLAFICWYTF